MVIELILKSLYFFLPAYFANMAPILFKWLPILDKPIWEKKLGKNKTWRGLSAAIIVGGVVFWIQKFAYQQGFQNLAIIDYADFTPLLGFLMGAGAIIGDAVKSYKKRKKSIKPGERWLFWDQLDFVFGALALGFFVYVPQAEVILVLVVASPVLHIAANHIGYWLGIRKVKW